MDGNKEVQSKFKRKIVQVSEAQKRIFEYTQNVNTEKIPLIESVGRRLAQELIAPIDLPHFRRSGMDGYAIRAIDTKDISSLDPIVLEVIETIPSGKVPSQLISTKQAARIMTGAMLPDGADAVIMFEMTEEFMENDKKYIRIKREIRKRQNVTEIGEEIESGTHLMDKGRKIGTGEIALLATFGFHSIEVYSRPTVAIISTGSELQDIEESLELGKIRNSNTSMIASLVLEEGGSPVLLDKLPDDLELAKSKISELFHTVDLVITTGGVSVGDYDIMYDFFDQWEEGNMLFNKVAMRPGSPTTVGVFQNHFLFALSGNPGACFVGFELFIRPVLKGMQGCKQVYPETFTAFLDEDFTKVNAFQRFIRATSRIEQGSVYVKPTGEDKSSIMVSIKDSNCLIVIPAGGQGLSKGDLVTAIRLKELE
ncbi:molybdopterin molybdotransferase MoeA [Chengkuizengella axinellae]|uniref:Molybdopterin molybdenumtransferase n=1 Tax=Chengkuizengella axinellae TaxID=3064388 RepID=A0ABT9J3P7_9BACL|nr:gephyrin-like molybdotransferase Glp [Chengkuizengella sp. 2205SS18-9]MDP5275609.1 molybdopterin molybdotransferase MoeA [Chengkuizengella sp. 2205SS18-9]